MEPKLKAKVENLPAPLNLLAETSDRMVYLEICVPSPSSSGRTAA